MLLCSATDGVLVAFRLARAAVRTIPTLAVNTAEMHPPRTVVNPADSKTPAVLTAANRPVTIIRILVKRSWDELEHKSPPNEKGQRPNKFHQWLTEDVGHPMLAQHLHSLIMFQRLALSSGYGWNRFVKTVDRVMPRRGSTLELPYPDQEANE